MRKSISASGVGLLLITAIVELLLHLPLVLIVYIYRPSFGVSLPELLLLLFGAYLFGCGVNALIRFVRAFPRLLIAAVIGGVGGIVVYGINFEGIYTAVLLAAAAFRGGRYAITPALLRLIPRDYVLGLMYYFFGSVIFSFKTEFDAYRTLMLLCGLFTLVVTLFQTNKSNVNRETLSGAVKPLVEPTVRRHNRIFVGLTAVVSVLIVLSYQLQAIFGAIGDSIVEMFRHLPKGGKEAPPPAANQDAAQLPPELMAKPSKTMPHWVDIVLYVIVGLVVCFLLYLLLRQLKHLPSWLRTLQSKLKDLFSRDKGSSTKGYVDQVERIRKSRKLNELFRGRPKEPRVRWKDLKDNESRIRYLYRRWIGSSVRKGYTFRPHLTPLEVAAELQSMGGEKVDSVSISELVHAYQQVRYGGGKISDEQLGRLADVMGRADGRNK